MSTNADRALYLDSSALVKLVVVDPQSPALRAFVDGSLLLVSCALARVEVVRSVSRHGSETVRAARALLEEIDLTQLDAELLDLASSLEAPLRSLDAVHVAAALELGDELEALVTYDVQMQRSAASLGLPVVSPS